MSIIAQNRAFSAWRRSCEVASGLIGVCDREGFVVRLFDSPSGSACVQCSPTSFPASFICRVCKTIWLSPRGLHGTAPSPPEIVISLAHEIGHMFDPPKPDEPAPHTDAADNREREREETAWTWAATYLSTDSETWAELGEIFIAVRRDREQAYRDRHARAAARRRVNR